MAMTLDVFKAQVNGLIGAELEELTNLQRYRIIKSAIDEYAKDFPAKYIEDVTGDAGKYYPLSGGSAILTYWSEGYSSIRSIQYPAPDLASDESPLYLDREDWEDDYWDTGIRYLFLKLVAPAATEEFRVEYTVPFLWTVSAVVETIDQTGHGFQVDDFIFKEERSWYEAVDEKLATHSVATVENADQITAKVLQVNTPDIDFFALCNLIASRCCTAISTKYSRTSDSLIRADAVDHPRRGGEFSRRAKEFLTQYQEMMGLIESDRVESPEGRFVDWDTHPTLSQSDRYLFHGRRE